MFVRKKRELVMLNTLTLSLMTDHALLIGSNNIYYFGLSNSSEHNSPARLIIFRRCFVTFLWWDFSLSSLRSWWHCLERNVR